MKTARDYIYCMKILGVCGSLRAGSSSMVVLNACAAELPKSIIFSIYPDLNKLPHFDDLAVQPLLIAQWREALKDAYAVIFCSPEYAFGVPGSLKNALDWTVSSGEFVDKPTAIIIASTGGEHAFASLKLTLSALSAKTSDKMSLLIPFIRAKIADNKITDQNTLQALKKVMDKLLNIAAEK